MTQQLSTLYPINRDENYYGHNKVERNYSKREKTSFKGLESILRNYLLHNAIKKRKSKLLGTYNMERLKRALTRKPTEYIEDSIDSVMQDSVR